MATTTKALLLLACLLIGSDPAPRVDLVRFEYASPALAEYLAILYGVEVAGGACAYARVSKLDGGLSYWVHTSYTPQAHIDAESCELAQGVVVFFRTDPQPTPDVTFKAGSAILDARPDLAFVFMPDASKRSIYPDGPIFHVTGHMLARLTERGACLRDPTNAKCAESGWR